MAERAFVVPLSNSQQTFTISLQGTSYKITNYWNDSMQNWVINIVDAKTETPLILSMPLVTGVDLLKQYRFLGIGGSLVVYTDGEGEATPTFDNLGVESNLYYVISDD